MKQQGLFKGFSIKGLFAGFLALGLFVLSCEEDSEDSDTKPKSSLVLRYRAARDNTYEFYVRTFAKDGQVVFEEGVPPERIKGPLRDYWKKSHVRWGIREKTSDKTETTVYWIQKNSAYKDPADKVQYQIEAPEERKHKLIPTDFPSKLLQKKVQDLEVVSVISRDKFKILSTVALPADFKTKLLQATEIYGQVRNKTAINKGLSGTDIIVPEALIYITHEDTGTIFYGRSNAQGNYHVSVRFGGIFSLSALKAEMQPFLDTFTIRLADGKKEIRDQNIDMLELPKGTTVEENQLYDIIGDKRTAVTGASSGLSVSGKTVSSATASAVAGATLLFYKKDTKKTYMLKSGADGGFSVNLPTNPGIGDNDETQLIFSASATGYTFEEGPIVLGKGGSVSSQLKVVELTPVNSSKSNTGRNKLSTPLSVRSTDTSSSSITVEWAQVTNASSYEVYYSKTSGFAIDGSGVTKVTVNNGSTTSKRVTGLQADSTYYFKVVATGSGAYSNSDASAEKSESTDARGSGGGVHYGKLTAPSTITLTPSSNSITVTWVQVAERVRGIAEATSYDVYYSTQANFNFGAASVRKKTVSSGSNATTSTNVSGLNANTAYYFKIVAKANNWTDSDASVEKLARTIKIKLATPTISSTTTTANSVTVNWNVISNASGYEVHYSKTSGFAIGGLGVTKVTVNSGSTTSRQITSLTAHTAYYFKMVAKGSGNYSDSDASVEKSATTGKTKLGTPTVNTPSAGDITDTSISLSWNRVSNASGYEVHYSKTNGFSIGGGGVTKVTVNSGNTTTQRVTSLTRNTSYYFKVVATGSGAYSNSDASAQQTVKTNKTKLSTPTVGTPSGNAITDTSISLSWNRVTNASGYEVHYSKTNGFAIGGTGVTKITVNSGSTTTQRITSLTRNTSYYFKVLATGSGGYSNSDASAQQTVTTGKTKLSTPTVSSPSAGDITDTSVSLSWGTVPNASGYEVHYSKTSGFSIGSGGVTKVTVSSGTSRSITGLDANTSYYFKVLAKGIGSYIDSDASAQQTVKTNKTKLGTPTVNTPSGVAITDTSILLSWSTVSNASGYKVYFSTTNGFSIVGASSRTINSGVTTSSRFTGLTRNTSYYFKVVATGSGGYSNSDASAQKTVKTNKTKLATPTVNTPSGGAIGDTSISLSWNRVTNASGYEVHYSKTNGFAIGGTGVSKRTVNGGGTTNSRFTGLDANTAYYFKVVAKGSGDYSNSAASAQKTATTNKAKLATPSNLRATNVSTNSITLSWNAVSNATSYKVYYWKTKGFPVPYYRAYSFTVSGTSRAFTTGISAGKTYYFKLVAKASGYIDSDVSSELAVTTKLATPTVSTPSDSAITENSVTLSWNRVTNASGYEIHYSKTSGFAIGGSGVTKVTVNSGSTTSQSITGLDASRAYYFKVLAKGTGIYSNSDASAQKKVTTRLPKLGLIHQGDSYNYFQLGWGWSPNAKPSGANSFSYKIYYSKNNNFNIGDAGVTEFDPSGGSNWINIRRQRFKVTTIDAGTSYYVAIAISDPGNTYLPSGLGPRFKVTTAAKTKLGTPTVGTPSDITSSAVRINWNAVANASGYQVYYSKTSGLTRGVTQVIVNSGSATSQRITGLTANTTYYFKVLATGSGGYSSSAASAQKTATTTKARLSAPSAFRALNVTANSAELLWGGRRDAEYYNYRIYYSTTNGFNVRDSGVRSKDVIQTDTTVLTGLNANTTYYFRIMTIGSGAYANSNLSSQFSATTTELRLATPGSLATSNIGFRSITVSWSVVANAASYELYGSTNNGFVVGSGSGYSTFTVNGTNRTITGLNPNRSYYFRVKAIGSGSFLDSDVSGQVSATTKNNKLATPTWGNVTPLRNGIKVYFSKVPNAVSYRIFIKKGASTFPMSSLGNWDIVKLDYAPSSNTPSMIFTKELGYFAVRIQALAHGAYSASQVSEVFTNAPEEDREKLREREKLRQKEIERDRAEREKEKETLETIKEGLKAVNPILSLFDW